MIPLLAQESTTVVGDLSTRGHVFIAVVTIAALIFILRLVRRRQLAGKYAMLWTAVAFLLGLLAIWPGLLTSLSEFVGVYYPPALFLLITTGFLFLIVIQFSWELSRNEDRTRTLAEEIALLRAELGLTDAAQRAAQAEADAGTDPSAPAPGADAVAVPADDTGGSGGISEAGGSSGTR